MYHSLEIQVKGTTIGNTQLTGQAAMAALWLGSIDYHAAWRLQRDLVDARVAGAIPDTLLLLEHPATITLGRAARTEHLLAAPARLREAGIEVVSVDRGGDVTYHGPGQLVGYPIVDLRARGSDLHNFLRQLEGGLIDVLGGIGIAARRLPPHTGVWVGDTKVAALGIKVSRWVSSHGFALNVCPEMEHFSMIVPCGIRDYGVTSISKLGRTDLTPRALAQATSAAVRRSLGSARADCPRTVVGLPEESREILRAAIDSAESAVLNS
ncbi:MAG: lipoyl(octanoyl) transferase LipB [Verrucomicrobiota bacterium]